MVNFRTGRLTEGNPLFLISPPIVHTVLAYLVVFGSNKTIYLEICQGN